MVPWDFTMENSMVISGDLVRIYGDLWWISHGESPSKIFKTRDLTNYKNWRW